MKFKDLVSVVGLVLAFISTSAYACTAEDWKACVGKPWVNGTNMETPLGAKWWPNPLWGADDQSGATNWYKKPEVILRAVSQVKKGKAMKIGQQYSDKMPLFGSRTFALRIPGAPTGGPFGPNRVIWYDEMLTAEIGQVGTQYDGLGHIGVQVGKAGDKTEMRFYNGVTVQEMQGSYGLVKLGAEHLNPIIARGILIDIAASRGVEGMDKGQEITMADVKAALKRQGMSDYKCASGDAIAFRTGWSRHWGKDNALYNSGEPGIGAEVARWLTEVCQVGVVGADTWAVEVVPNPDAACVFCIHQFLLARHGVAIQENLNLEGLVKEGVYQFMWTYSPVPIVGATGSIGNPVATW
ncbi:MAG: cyclase family protein [Proteobacteria bacterium]|nr:cyclase family protein [Pseudomonadota bacterium]